MHLIEMLGLLTGLKLPDCSTWYIPGFWQVWYAGVLHKLKSYGISGQIHGLISSFVSNRQLWVVLEGKSSQEYLVNASVPQGSILGLMRWHNDLPDDVICDIAIYPNDTTLYSKCD